MPTLSRAIQSLLNPYAYRRRSTRTVRVGAVGVGGDNPIRLQSMTITSTMDTAATVEQVRRLADVGCEIVRITAPTVREARNLGAIKGDLLRKNCLVPLVADIHFRPDAALEAAEYVEKVRINPGNYVDGKAFKVREYTDGEYEAELRRIEDRFTPLVEKLKRMGKAIRIGTNHGSLSDRIMNRYGDTPLGMVESALEFTRICRKNDFHDIIFSMKASNPRVMVAAYRMLAEKLDALGWDYPFHLGVTEAGDGEDGRIKSAVGIGSLLEDGIGDTIRVSLTEDPEFEVPVAAAIARAYRPDAIGKRQVRVPIPPNLAYVENRTAYGRRVTEPLRSGPFTVGGAAPICVAGQIDLRATTVDELVAFLERRLKADTPIELVEVTGGDDFGAAFAAFQARLAGETSRLAIWASLTAETASAAPDRADGYVFRLADGAPPEDVDVAGALSAARKTPLAILGADPEVVAAAVKRAVGQGATVLAGVSAGSDPAVQPLRALAALLGEGGIACPLWLEALDADLRAATVLGGLICDGIGDVVRIGSGLRHGSVDFSFNLLQACGSRLIKTEYVSCPSCGRTLFDLQATTERIKSKTGHLKGVKIAIMGCIVNGPGEMADADFGYVGGGPGKINLYVGKSCVEKSIPAAIADEKLIELIKNHGKWVDPRS